MNQYSKEPKEWHQTQNSNAREKFRKNFIDSLILMVNFSTWFVFRKYLTIFDDMENEAYGESDSRAAYYFNVAQKTYKICDTIREENSLFEGIDQLNLNDNNCAISSDQGQPITNSEELKIIENCIKYNFQINEDCPENCNHIKCTTTRKILKHLVTCSRNVCSTPFCNASKDFLKHFKSTDKCFMCLAVQKK